jgi:Tol biopolymer transport system component
MGEVYRARDTRLGREVAVKVLPDALSKDNDRMQRFEQEASVLSALNHPNLLVMFDVGTTNGLKYLVSEFLEGRTLREYMNGGALPQRKVAEYSTKIASGLAAAHQKGIVHRDLKPENVFITKDEQVKILDFGLAKYTMEVKEAGTTLTAGPGATAPGTVMGTAGYMSPEQVKGEAADPRSDIFSFGAMLYEMVSGKRAFAGDTAVETMNAILKNDPSLAEAGDIKMPLGLERIVQHCLEKNPADRFQSARDLGFALSALSGTGATAAVRKAEGKKWWSAWKWALVVVAVGFVGATAEYLSTARAPSWPEVRAVLPVPSGVAMITLGDQAGAPAISPDGSNLVFAGIAEGRQMLFLRAMDSTTARPLAGTDGGKFPFWSPDGKSVGFFADQQLKRVDIAGGPPISLAPATDARGGTWAADTILYSPYIYETIWRVPASGGKAVRVTSLDPALHTTHRWPHFLPDAKHFLYLAAHHMSGKEGNSGVYAGSIDGGTPKFILRTNGGALYSSGELLYFREGSLMAQEFNAERLELRGDARPIGPVLRETGNWGVIASASDNGVLLFQSSGEVKYPILWFDRTGRGLGPAPISGQLQDLRLSPDGTRALTGTFEGPTADITICDLKTGARTRLTFGENIWFAAWSPDGKRVAYSAQKTGTGNTELYLKRADGSEERQLLLSSGNIDHPTDWTRNGKYLLINRGQVGSQRIWIVPMFGDRKPFPLFPNAVFSQTDGRVSPNGKWVAYVSTESGPGDIYVSAFPGGTGKWQVSTGGVNPAASWRDDGKELYFESLEGNMMAASIQESAGTITIEKVRPLFRSPFLNGLVRTIYEVDPKGGQRFIGAAAPDTSALPLNVITNWTAELRKK